MVIRDTPTRVWRLANVLLEAGIFRRPERQSCHHKILLIKIFRKESLRIIPTSKKRSGTDHCKDSGRNCGDPLADKTAEERAGVKGRYNDPRGDFATECHYSEDELDKGTVYKPANVFWWRTIGLMLADP